MFIAVQKSKEKCKISLKCLCQVALMTEQNIVLNDVYILYIYIYYKNEQ